MKFCCYFVAESNMELRIIELLLIFFAVEYHSHSSCGQYTLAILLPFH